MWLVNLLMGLGFGSVDPKMEKYLTNILSAKTTDEFLIFNGIERSLTWQIFLHKLFQSLWRLNFTVTVILWVEN